ncbi:protein LDOC1-like [Ambystoma mexicanum]|uniref:protein LDOC1-like n=1 Tax=Ambystoma mexicanum TaxID=8296 RepID=UPI0037E701D5
MATPEQIQELLGAIQKLSQEVQALKVENQTLQQISQEVQTLKAENVVLKQLMTARDNPPEPELPPMPLSSGKFDGASRKVKEFLDACKLYFTYRPILFATSKARVGFMISNRSGNALSWVTPLVMGEDPSLQDYEGFCTLIKQTFERPETTYLACEDLLDAHQGSMDVLTYISNFKTLAA